MNMTLIKYRTKYLAYNQYAVVPTHWLSDFLDWLTLSELAEIVSTDNNTTHGYSLPSRWPNIGPCLDEMVISDLIAAAR